MDIGGFDMCLPGNTEARDVAAILSVVGGDVWPDAVVHGVSSVCPVRDWATSWSRPADLFIYETQSAFGSWEAHGRTDTNDRQMIAVMFESDALSFVVNDASSETKKIVDLMMEAVKASRSQPRA